MKTRGPLAGQKTLPMRRFRTIGLERQMRTALGPTGTRKTAQSSLKIEGLRRTVFPRSRERGHIETRAPLRTGPPWSIFRAHVSAATLKPYAMEEIQ
jgi:hypothetical protein